MALHSTRCMLSRLHECISAKRPRFLTSFFFFFFTFISCHILDAFCPAVEKRSKRQRRCPTLLLLCTSVFSFAKPFEPRRPLRCLALYCSPRGNCSTTAITSFWSRTLSAFASVPAFPLYARPNLDWSWAFLRRTIFPIPSPSLPPFHERWPLHNQTSL